MATLCVLEVQLKPQTTLKSPIRVGGKLFGDTIGMGHADFSRQGGITVDPKPLVFSQVFMKASEQPFPQNKIVT